MFCGVIMGGIFSFISVSDLNNLLLLQCICN